MQKLAFFLALIGGLNSPDLFTQEKQAGPVLEDFGKVWEVTTSDFKTDSEKVFQVVFDIDDSPELYSDLNSRIETAARFLNMHARHGVAPERMKLSLVVHGKATKDILKNEDYRKRFGLENPNRQLLKALLNAGVEVIVCGQSAAARNVPKEAMLPEVQLALSAMTALVQLQDMGYQLIKF